MNVYIKQQASSAICRRAPQLCGTTLHTAHRSDLHSAALSLLVAVQHQNLPPHNVCASHSPWRGDFWGGTHLRSGTKHLCAVRFEKKMKVFLKSSESVHRPAGQSSKMASRSKSFCGPDDSLPLADILVLCGSYPLMLQKGVGQKICHVSNCCQRLKHCTYDSSLRWF